jgi:hypothetical protein
MVKPTNVSDSGCDIMAKIIISDIANLMMDTYVSVIDSVSIIRVLVSYMRILVT